MKAQVIPIQDLSVDLQNRWAELQASQPLFRGPPFLPEIFMAVGKFYEGIKIGLLEENGQMGFLPFLKDPRRPVAKPVPLCDYQAFISSPQSKWEITPVLKQLDLVAWDFEHLVAGETLLSPSADLQPATAARVSRAGTFEAYVEELKQRDLSLKNLLNKRKQIERRVGPLRFVSAADDDALFKNLFEWKAQRFNQGRAEPKWVTDVLQYLHRNPTSRVQGALSVLYAGDEVVAIHFGLVSQKVLYYWIPAFNPALSRYTPGWLLVYELIRNLERFGANLLDFGPGGEAYKRYFFNDELPIARGCFEAPSILAFVRRSQREVIRTVRGNPWLREGLKPVVKAVRRLKQNR